MKRMLLQLN